ncbi:hypothetical protein DE146DRAFT_701511 [Phaeosphaeria sp. MPI-PUGE-AT-0046c]|nr:hypothetical protein DE146DRAFT_321834 [Phaeosphaeria sp. MPI-PUGE-AT-0046c]KAH7386670.1 hypothetical protein DE146DRAFT_701511 [Phaeosphaeria sp. MPI-PUGE-AT-0046c]
MASNEEQVQIDAMDIGLDRSHITQKRQVELPKPVSGDNDDTQQIKAVVPSSHFVTTLKERKEHTAIKIRRKLHVSKVTDVLKSAPPLLANSNDEPSISRLVHKLPTPDKPTIKDFMQNPIATVKSKVSDRGNQQVAANIAAKEIPHGEEVDLINAHDAVRYANTEKERSMAIQDVERLMEERQSTYARWSLDRHITKLRVLSKETMVRKPQAEFQQKDGHGHLQTNWKAYVSHLLGFYCEMYGGQYVGYGSNPPKPSKETIMPNIERLIIATSPFQEFIMTTRRVYRWENRAETMKYLCIYLILWYINLLLPGILSAIFYLVIERRFHGNTLEDLREEIKHREDTQRTALSLSEFIEKRGDEKWADDIVSTLGPWLMIQLADLANFFESIRNFYEWRKPTRTAATLVVLTGIIVACSLLPTWFLVKAITLSMGFTFFALFPLATNFPDYRLLVSPTKRLLWNIPTHAEWAIQYIQAEGTRIIDGMALSKPVKLDTLSPITHDSIYTGSYASTKGHLIVDTTSCRFISHLDHAALFHVPHAQLELVEKMDRVVAKKLPAKIKSNSGKDLKISLSKGGEREYVVQDMEKRDEAFGQIVGFSGRVWQVIW